MNQATEMHTTSRAAALLGVHSVTIIRWIKAGHVKAVLLPTGHYRIPQAEIDRLLGEAA